MKKHNFLLILSLSAITIMTSCGGNSSKRPVITNKVVKDLYLYNYNSARKEFVKLSSAIKTYYFNDSSIPYLSLKDYIDAFLNKASLFSWDGYKYEVHGGNADITLKNNNFKGKLTINTDAQSLTYDSYSGYTSNSTDALYPLYQIIQGGEYLFKNLKYEYKSGSIYTVDLTKYNIKAFYDNNEVYLPYHASMTALGINVKPLIYNGNGYYLIEDAESVEELFNALKLVRNTSSNDAFNSEYMQYAYDHLSFTFDNFYGLDKRNKRTGNKEEHVYFKDGAYKALEKYKSDLLSTKDNVSDDALISFYNECVNDGGHSSYHGNNIFSTKISSIALTGDIKYVTDSEIALNNARAKAGLNPKTKGEDFIGFVETRRDEENKNKFLFVTIDEFHAHETKYTREYFSDDKYGQCSITIIGKANEIIQNDKTIKNVVIDMSCNHGGQGYMPLQILSWINKGNMNFTIKNNMDGSYLKGSGQADINLDDKFDEKDYLPEDVNVYVICSPSSYSSGNYAPCLASEVSKVKFIGERSGGGSCNIAKKYNAYGSQMTISGDTQLCFNNLRDGKITSDEVGVTPTFYPIPLPPEDYQNAPKFFDRNAIINKILNS